MVRLFLLLLLAIPGFGQITSIPGSSGIAKGTALPATCSVGDVFFDTDAPAGANIYGCTSSNTWTLQSGASGSSATYGTYASLPATCSTGDLYNTSDTIYGFQCTATNTWTAFTGNERVVVPPTSGWNWDNQGSSTLDTTYGYQSFLFLNTGGNNVRMYYRTAPATPYTFKVRMGGIRGYLGGVTVNNAAEFGIGFRDGTGKIVAFATGFTGSLWEQKVGYWTNSTTISSTPASNTNSAMEDLFEKPAIWLAGRDNGTNLYFYFSFTGVGTPGTSGSWIQFWSASRTAFFGAGPTQLGIVGNINSTDTPVIVTSFEVI